MYAFNNYILDDNWIQKLVKVDTPKYSEDVRNLYKL